MLLFRACTCSTGVRAPRWQRGARHTHGCVGSFALWRPHKERPRAQLFAYDVQQLAASSTALWQPGLVPVPKQNLESKKLPHLADRNTLANKRGERGGYGEPRDVTSLSLSKPKSLA